MKVLFVNNSYPPHPGRGPALSTQGLAEQLSSQGVQVVVVTAMGQDKPVKRSLNGVTVYDVCARTRPLLALESIIDQERPDLINTVAIVAFSERVWAIAKTRNIPIVHGVHEYYLLCLRQTLFASGRNCAHACFGCNIARARRRKASALVDAVVAVSRFTLERHTTERFFPNAKAIRVVHVGIDVPYREPHGDPGHSGLRLGYLGRISLEKGIFWLLSELTRIEERGWRLSIGGVGNERDLSLIRQFEQDTNIDYLGFVDPIGFLAGIDVLVVPSLWGDPMPRVAIEALASGVPILAARRGGLIELADAFPHVVFGFDPRDPGAFGALVQGMIRDPTRVRGLERDCYNVRKHFSPEVECRMHLELYEALCATR